MDNTEQASPEKSKRLGWRFFLLLFLGILTTFTLLIVWWLNSSSDLNHLRQRLADNDLPQTSAEYYSGHRDRVLRAAVDDMYEILDRGLIRYVPSARTDEILGISENFMYYGPESVGESGYDRGLQSDALKYYQYDNVRAAYLEFRDLLQKQMGKRLTVVPDDLDTSGWYDLGNFYELYDFLADYAFAGDKQHFEDVLGCMLDLHELIPRATNLFVDSNGYSLNDIGRVLQNRFEIVSLATLERYRNMVLRPVLELQHANVGASLYVLDKFELGFTDSEQKGLTGYNTGDPVSLFFGNIKLRYIRSFMGGLLVDAALVKCETLKDLDTIDNRVKDYADQNRHRWGGQKLVEFSEVVSAMYVKLRQPLAFADLLIAVKKGEPIPFDAYGNPFKPIEKDGKVLGYYSIGQNAVDDGWENEYPDPIWLFGYLEKP